MRGLSSRQRQVLLTMQGAGSSYAEIMRLFGLSSSSNTSAVTRSLNNLVQKGLIKRPSASMNDMDRYILTDAGEAALASPAIHDTAQECA